MTHPTNPVPARSEGWQPIETAPKDGNSILLTDARVIGWTQVAAWEEDHGGWQADDSSAIWHKDMFTHWRPLPPPPGTEPESGENDDPTASSEWNAGCDFALLELCTFLDVKPHDVSWDAATETVDGDVRAIIGNILRARLGEDWSATSSPASSKASHNSGERLPSSDGAGGTAPGTTTGSKTLDERIDDFRRELREEKETRALPADDARKALADRLAGHLGPFNFITADERDLVISTLLANDARNALTDEIEAALEQAQNCIKGETPEDISDAEAREDTINKVRSALRAMEILRTAPIPVTPEEVARVIYDAFPFDGHRWDEHKPEWIPNGNSRMQDEARRAATAILALLHAAPQGGK